MAGIWANAARNALRGIGHPGTISEIWTRIQETGFNHNSKEPEQTLRNEIRRNCKGVDHISPGHSELIFYQPEAAVYGLYEWIERDNTLVAEQDPNFEYSEIQPGPHGTNAKLSTAAFRLPEEIARPDEVFEGARISITINAFERNLNNRRACIKAHGARCSVCNFDFETVYGSIARAYIHVHHLRPLSEVREAHIVDPVADLRPVCPNCHAVLHLKVPALSISELKSLIEDQLKRRFESRAATPPSESA